MILWLWESHCFKKSWFANSNFAQHVVILYWLPHKYLCQVAFLCKPIIMPQIKSIKSQGYKVTLRKGLLSMKIHNLSMFYTHSYSTKIYCSWTSLKLFDLSSPSKFIKLLVQWELSSLFECWLILLRLFGND